VTTSCAPRNVINGNCQIHVAEPATSATEYITIAHGFDELQTSSMRAMHPATERDLARSTAIKLDTSKIQALTRAERSALVRRQAKDLAVRAMSTIKSTARQVAGTFQRV